MATLLIDLSPAAADQLAWKFIEDEQGCSEVQLHDVTKGRLLFKVELSGIVNGCVAVQGGGGGFSADVRCDGMGYIVEFRIRGTGKNRTIERRNGYGDTSEEDQGELRFESWKVVKSIPAA